MSETNRSEYKNQLPKLGSKFDLLNSFSIISGIGSIAGVILFYAAANPDLLSKIYAAYILAIATLFIGLSIYLTFRKDNRYAQAVLFIHLVNHCIRDYIALLSIHNEKPKKEHLKNILDSIAECFSVLTATKCRVALKGLNQNLELVTVERNSSSSIDRMKVASMVKHSVDSNTDFCNLWYSINGCSRYYLSNNLRKEFLKQQYSNTSFESYGGKPVISHYFVYSRVSNWRLPYESTLVVPIRYIKDFNPPVVEGTVSNSQVPGWEYWGFLCIDSNKKNIFDRRFAPEIAAAFADVLFIYFSVISKLGDSNDAN